MHVRLVTDRNILLLARHHSGVEEVRVYNLCSLRLTKVVTLLLGEGVVMDRSHNRHRDLRLDFSSV